MGDKKIIAVVGATGAQVGGLVRAIMNDPSGGFSARAITRDINSGKAKELSKMGAEVVSEDIDNERSLEKALHGAYGAYFVTFYWEHLSPDKEMAEARIWARGLPSTPSDGHQCFDADRNGSIDLASECSNWHEFVLPMPSEAKRRPDIPFKRVQTRLCAAQKGSA